MRAAYWVCQDSGNTASPWRTGERSGNFPSHKRTFLLWPMCLILNYHFWKCPIITGINSLLFLFREYSPLSRHQSYTSALTQWIILYNIADRLWITDLSLFLPLLHNPCHQYFRLVKRSLKNAVQILRNMKFAVIEEQGFMSVYERWKRYKK